ncbi:hypothetical protein [Hymenobacter profundi]|uniref:Uncharacterized protein n=1 Tax=Hymenobacter profundi TaxID=1982110 RepID=A0ABS6WZZ1_9BACT|nr:hypothetical protein [Hymenobacter profundi]MBW3129004.1 hypothetical protein [Hymenobacter profundi]
MFLLSTRFLSRLRFALLTATVLFVLGLNHQTVTTFRVAPGKTTRVGVRPKAAVIKQKVNLEAVGPLVLHVAPDADAWLPFPTPQHWLPAVRRALAVPRPLAGILPSSIFRVRLLVAALSPQAP